MGVSQLATGVSAAARNGLGGVRAVSELSSHRQGSSMGDMKQGQRDKQL